MQVDLPQLGTAQPEPNGDLLLADAGLPDESELRSGPATTALGQLLVGYGEVLDRIAARPPIVFLPHRCVPERPGPCVVVPRVNRMAAMLAEAHVAARLDALLGRGMRFRALNPRGANPLDLASLQDFRNSLSPVSTSSAPRGAVVGGTGARANDRMRTSSRQHGRPRPRAA